ncbi:unnamed protein product [Linum trigynum]|uniref:Uncharacterized protein n=1 Tax=Linum trigynum TaxID=586398 RepID=A0AAV2FG14_9ROSI
MKRASSLFRLLSASSRSRILQSSPEFIQSSKSPAAIVSRYANPTRFYSSESDPWSRSNPEKQQRSDPSSLEGVDVVSDEELKRRIERFYNGDGDAIPSIFEAILARKLAGVSDDENLMKELREKFPMENVDKEGGFDFDEEELDDDDDEEDH